MLKPSLKKKAERNAQVTKGTSKNQTTLKEGVPNDPSVKHLSTPPIVGVSIGTTLNMGDYQSLRVDVWLTDNVDSGESFEDAYQRVSSTVGDVLSKLVEEYRDE